MAEGAPPTDAPLLAGLRAASPSAVAALAAAAAAWTARDGSSANGRWAGGDRLADGSTSMPYVVLDASVEAVVRALAGVGAVVPFDWPAWAAANRERFGTASAVAGASAADAVRLVTSFVRGDRFSEGLLLEVADDGRLRAAVDVLLRWLSAG